MSDESEESAPHIGAPPRSDVVLTVLCKVADEHDDFAVNLTVNVPGGTVTGLLVGPDTWFSELSAAYEGQLAGTVDPIYRALSEAKAEVPEEDRVYEFVHLRDARFLVGGEPMPNGRDRLFWRGRLSQVSGWAFGSIGSS